jgi:hypothetical protein
MEKSLMFGLNSLEVDTKGPLYTQYLETEAKKKGHSGNRHMTP